MSAATMITIPMGQIHESSLNPRRTFEVPALQQLAESLLSHGQLTPVIVREHPTVRGHYELAAGHRRYRAAAIAKLPTLDALVRSMDDTAFLEVLTIENLQREDVHPLEEAEGYAALLKQAKGYDIAKIATRVGKSPRYVYDRLHLLQLVPLAQELFRAGHLTLGHAVVLARHSSVIQERLVGSADASNGEMFRRNFNANSLDRDDLDAQLDMQLASGQLVPWSVKELEAWLVCNVRLALQDDVTTELFPEAKAALEYSAAHALEVVEICCEWTVPKLAKSKAAPVLSQQQWRHAGENPDDKVGKPCDHQQLGVVVVGRHQGKAFPVCTAKTACKTHWRREIQDAAAAAKAKGKPAAEPKKQPWQIRQEQEQAAREAWKATFAAVGSELRKAFAEHVSTMPLKATDKLVQRYFRGSADAQLLPGDTFESCVRAHLAQQIEPDNWSDRSDWLAAAKEVGLDIKPILKAAAKADAVVPAAKKKAARKVSA